MTLLLFLACTPPEDPASMDVPATLPLQSPLDRVRADPEALHAIAWEDGWPVDTPEGWLFALRTEHDWALAGDFNAWSPTPMDCDAGLCTLVVPIAEPAGARYKFVRGEDFVADPLARGFGYDDFGEFSWVRPPAEGAHIERWPAAMGHGVSARDLRVYVPPGTGPFPVLYAHDGQNLFDPMAIGGGWRLQEALAGRSILVVGIDNTPDRFDDYTPTVDDLGDGEVGGNGGAYAIFVHDVVRPHIEASYPTSETRGQLGSSLGGLVALHIAWSHPGEYAFVGSLSGTLGWGRYADLAPSEEARWMQSDPGGVIFASTGGGPGDDGLCTDPDGDGTPEDDPDDGDNYCVNRQFVDALAAAGRTWDTDLFHWHEPGAMHTESTWAEVVGRHLDVFESLGP